MIKKTIKTIGYTLGVLLALDVGLWFLGANCMKKELSNIEKKFEGHGILLKYGERVFSGFPFKMNLSLKSLEVNNKASGFEIKVPECVLSYSLMSPLSLGAVFSGGSIISVQTENNPTCKVSLSKPLWASWRSGCIDIASENVLFEGGKVSFELGRVSASVEGLLKKPNTNIKIDVKKGNFVFGQTKFGDVSIATVVGVKNAELLLDGPKTWGDSGGKIDIISMVLNVFQTKTECSGIVKLDNSLGLEANLDVKLDGLGAFGILDKNATPTLNFPLTIQQNKAFVEEKMIYSTDDGLDWGNLIKMFISGKYSKRKQ